MLTEILPLEVCMEVLLHELCVDVFASVYYLGNLSTWLGKRFWVKYGL